MLEYDVDLVFMYMDYKDEFTRSFGPEVYFCLASDSARIMHSAQMGDSPVTKRGTFICLRNLLYNSGSHIIAPLVLVRPKA